MYLYTTYYTFITYFPFYNPARSFPKKNIFFPICKIVYPRSLVLLLILFIPRYPTTKLYNKFIYCIDTEVYIFGTSFVFLYHIKRKQFFPNFYASN